MRFAPNPPGEKRKKEKRNLLQVFVMKRKMHFSHSSDAGGSTHLATDTAARLLSAGD